MDRWIVSDELSTSLDDVQRVVVRIVAGDLTVTAASPGGAGVSPAQGHLDVRREAGADVTVELNNGTLFVSQPEPDISPIERFIKYVTESRRHRCSVAINAPADAGLELTTVSADVVASGFDGGSKIKTVSGDVTMSALRSEVSVVTVSGVIEAKDIAAGLKLKTVSGDMTIVEGACRWLDAKSVSGDVLLDLDLDPTGTYDVSTVSGDVVLRTTSEPSVAIDATSVSGRLMTDFGLRWNSGPGRRSVSETVGDGGARLWVKTVSGDLRVLRGRAVA